MLLVFIVFMINLFFMQIKHVQPKSTTIQINTVSCIPFYFWYKDRLKLRMSTLSISMHGNEMYFLHAFLSRDGDNQINLDLQRGLDGRLRYTQH